MAPESASVSAQVASGITTKAEGASRRQRTPNPDISDDDLKNIALRILKAHVTPAEMRQVDKRTDGTGSLETLQDVTVEALRHMKDQNAYLSPSWWKTQMTRFKYGQGIGHLLLRNFPSSMPHDPGYPQRHILELGFLNFHEN